MRDFSSTSRVGALQRPLWFQTIPDSVGAEERISTQWCMLVQSVTIERNDSETGKILSFREVRHVLGHLKWETPTVFHENSLDGAFDRFPTLRILLTTKLRFSMLAFAFAALAGVFTTSCVFADDDHKHAAGQDHASMMKAEKTFTDALAKLSPEDQKLAAAQRFCPVMTYDRLGAMGTPLKVMVEGKPVFLCCKACTEDAMKDGAATFKTVEKLKAATAELAKLPMEERMAAEAQKYCAIKTDSLLGSMGAPIKLTIEGKPVYLCCDGCTAKAKANPTATLAKVEELKHAGMKDDHVDHKHVDKK